MDNTVDSVLGTKQLSRAVVIPRTLYAALRHYSRFDHLASTHTEYRGCYGSDATRLVQNAAREIADIPFQEIEAMLVHTLTVAPVVTSFAPECMYDVEGSMRELEEFSDYLYSHFRYDRASDTPKSASDLNFMRGAAIEYYVGNSTDSAPDHLEWLGSKMIQINAVSGTLSQHASVDRGLIESLLSIETRSLADGML